MNSLHLMNQLITLRLMKMIPRSIILVIKVQRLLVIMVKL